LFTLAASVPHSRDPVRPQPGPALDLPAAEHRGPRREEPRRAAVATA